MHTPEMRPRIRTIGIAAGGAMGGAILTYGAMVSNGYERQTAVSPIEFKMGYSTPENLQELEANLVTLRTTLKPEFRTQVGEDIALNCNGFVMRNAKGSPFFVSSEHCLPTVIQKSDGTQLSAFSQSGKSILHAEAKDRNGAIYGINDAAYLSTEWSIANDLTILSPQTPNHINQEGFKASDKKLKAGDQLSLLRLENSELKVVPLHVLSVNTQGVITLIALENPDSSCVKGASGSPIVESQGKLAGILSSGTESMTIDTGYAIEHRLGLDFVGKTVRECYAASSQGIVNLLNTR
ncbi:MAG: hypothetical protein KA035_00095 [Candidatus Levybacteria bacterium]|nr:hypothetical protein [Candidatus Levybacteria bacterium]